MIVRNIDASETGLFATIEVPADHDAPVAFYDGDFVGPVDARVPRSVKSIMYGPKYVVGVIDRGSPATHMRHSDTPNCKAWSFDELDDKRFYVYALHRIRVGDEFTLDYNDTMDDSGVAGPMGAPVSDSEDSE